MKQLPFENLPVSELPRHFAVFDELIPGMSLTLRLSLAHEAEEAAERANSDELREHYLAFAERCRRSAYH